MVDFNYNKPLQIFDPGFTNAYGICDKQASTDTTDCNEFNKKKLFPHNLKSSLTTKLRNLQNGLKIFIHE